MSPRRQSGIAHQGQREPSRMALELDAALADCGNWSVVRVSRDPSGRREHYLQPDLDVLATADATAGPVSGRPATRPASGPSGLFDWQESA